jgi:large-conductance mechanosensitive channel
VVFLASNDEMLEPTGHLFGVGNFLVALVTFIVVAFVIFLIVKTTKKWGMD